MASCSALPIVYYLSVQKREVPAYISKNQAYKNLKLFFRETPPNVVIEKPSPKLVYRMPIEEKNRLVSYMTGSTIHASMSGTTIHASPYSFLLADELQDTYFKALRPFAYLNQPRTIIFPPEIFKNV